jgi:hypothetical protein
LTTIGSLVMPASAKGGFVRFMLGMMPGHSRQGNCSFCDHLERALCGGLNA